MDPCGTIRNNPEAMVDFITKELRQLASLSPTVGNFLYQSSMDMFDACM